MAVDSLLNGVLNSAIDTSESFRPLMYVLGLVEVCWDYKATIKLELVLTEELFSTIISNSKNTDLVLSRASSRLSLETKAVA
jgi:hypothetical protein